MAVIDTSRSHAPVAGIFGQTVAKIINAVTTWNDNRVTRKALSALSDRELDDIGLTRADIDRIGIYH